MAEYELTITKRELNPKWKPEPPMMGYYDREVWQRDHGSQPQYLEYKTLAVVVDEATFAAIRKAAVETL